MYGLVIPDSTERDIDKVTQGFTAYAYFRTHAAVRAKAIDMIRHKLKKTVNDILIEDILAILETDLLAHDYDDDRAYNETAGVQMSIENYILKRLSYAISTYMRKEQSDKSIVVKTGVGTTYTVPVNTFSLDAPLDSSGDSDSDLGEVIPDTSRNADTIAFEAVEPDYALADLIERISRLASWSDTNIDVILYATVMLDLLCYDTVDRDDVLKQALTALGITNYISAKQFAHNEDFIDISKDVSMIEDKQMFVATLSHHIFCVKQITATLKWIAEEANKNTEV